MARWDDEAVRFRLPAAWVLACVLHVSCGVLVAALAPWAGHTENLGGVLVVGGVAALDGVIIALLPWHRWRPTAVLWLVPESLALVAAFNHFSGNPHLYALFFLVIWVWVGLTQKPGVATLFTPVLLLFYVGGSLHGGHPGTAVSAWYVIPCCVLLGEATAWVSAALRDAEQARRRSERRFASLVRHATEFVSVVEADGRLAYVSPSSERLLGRPPAELVGALALELVHPDDLDAVRHGFAEAKAEGTTRRPVEYRVADGRGGWTWVEGTISHLLDDPEVAGIVVNGRDIEERRAAQQRLAVIAYEDSLTGLPNRAAFLDALHGAVDRSRAEGRAVGVLFFDLDGFKVVNDSLGHTVGDRILSAVARRVREALPPSCFVARLGGDEFVALLGSIRDEGDAVAAAEAVLAAFHQPFPIDGRQIAVTTSVGIAASTTADGEQLVGQADLAMFHAKELGRGGYHVFDEALERDALRRLDLQTELRTAIDQGELFIRYQPELDLESGSVVGMEALVRWMHPSKGELVPAHFLDVAEASGLIVPLGELVLEQACSQLRTWRDQVPGAEGLAMGVNVSAQQVREPGFVETVARIVGAAGVPAGAIRLELTEGILLEPDLAGRCLTELRDLGVELAIDDFGTGYSSLSYLQRLPIHTVKIDKAFLAPVLAAADEAPLVAAIISMAGSLGLDVVAEGVETPAQLALLRRLGCRRGQGYLFARPLASAEAERFLRESTRATASIPVR